MGNKKYDSILEDHFRRNLRLPEDLTLLINEVNAWLKLGWK